MKGWIAALALAAALAGPRTARGEDSAPPPPKDPAPEETYREALGLFQNREFEKAEKALDRVLAARPDHLLALYLRGAARLSLGRYGPAREDFDAAVRAKPDFAKAVAQRGRACLGLEAWDDAVRDLESALRLDPSDRGWKLDLDQARMLRRGAQECGPGKPFPAVPLETAGPGASRKVPDGLLLPLLSVAERAGGLLGGARAPYRGAWIVFFASVDSPLDRAYLAEIQEALPDLSGRGYTVAAVSPEPAAKIARLRDEKDLGFPLFSDPGGRAAWRLGILNARFADIGEPLPSLFVTDAAGTVRLRKVAFDPRRREPVEKVLKDLD